MTAKPREQHEYEFWGFRHRPRLDGPVDSVLLPAGEDTHENLKVLARQTLRWHGLDRCTVYRMAPDRRFVMHVLPSDGVVEPTDDEMRYADEQEGLR